MVSFFVGKPAACSTLQIVEIEGGEGRMASAASISFRRRVESDNWKSIIISF